MQEAIVIIGGGLAGLSVAYELSKHTQQKLVILEAGKLGSGCTTKAAGLLTPVTEMQLKDDPFLPIITQSLNYYPGFVNELTHKHPQQVDFKNDGNLLCAFDSDGERDLARIVDFKKTLGFEIVELSREQLQSKEPFLSQRVQSAFFAPHEGAVDPIALVKVLKQELSASTNCRVLENTAVTGITLQNNRIKAITLANGELLACSHVVLASGLQHNIPELQASFPVPLRPVKGEAVSILTPPNSLNHPVQIYHRYPVYLCPRSNGEIIIGATVDEKNDEDNTAGGILDLLFAAWQVLPMIAEHKFNGAWAGRRPTTPDNYPIAGRTNIDNMVTLLGLYRKGILLAPYLGAQVAKLLLDKPTDLNWSTLRYDRF